MSDTPRSLSALLSQLQSLPSTATAAEMDAILRRPQSDRLERARALTGLVRSIDGDLYGFLQSGTSGVPTLAETIEAFPGDFDRLSAERWVMRSSAREAVLAQWQSSASVARWREHNTALFEYFRAREGKASELEAVYHGVAGVVPRDAIEFFAKWYKDADDRYDFAHCAALLEAVALQKDFRGSDVSREFRDKARYLQSRLLFLDALQKTAAYVERDTAHRTLGDVVNRRTPGAPEAWIFHVHATGGLGKTMMLRWFVARDWVPRRVPCAVVDFDDYSLLTFVQYPLRLLQEIIGQWARQMPQAVFVDAADALQKAGHRPGWDTEALDALRSRLQSANVQDEMTVVLDTLEGPTLSQPAWLKTCLSTLREHLHSHLPRLTMILAGRYNLNQIEGVFESGEAVTYELRPFSRAEATSCLVQHTLTDARMQDAIMTRAIVVATDAPPPSEGSEPTVAPLFNPFKLGLLAELVLDRKDLQPEDIERLPNVDIAYLIERVILRIESQPIRWMIRYGALARGLQLPFLERVLLPRLRAALRGSTDDLLAQHLSPDVRRYLDAKVTWTPDPDLAEQLDPTTLWEELKVYARDRGWISVGSDNSLRFHPEVVRPVQVLLSEEPIFRTLHASARDFCLERRRDPSLSPAQRARAAADAVYHTAALNPRAARTLWRSLAAEADLDSAYQLATDAFGPSYRDANGAVLYPTWFCEALVEAARVKMHEAGVDFSAESAAGRAFATHVQAALRLDPTAVPELFAAIAATDAIDATAEASRLEQQLGEVSGAYDELWLHIRMAHALESAPDRADAHWWAAARAAAHAGVPQVAPANIEAVLADRYARAERYTDAMQLYERARAAGNDVETLVRKQLNLALRARDSIRVRALLRDAAALVPSLDLAPVRLWQDIVDGDLTSFFSNLQSLKSEPSAADRTVELLLLEGAAHRLLMNYERALEMYSRATEIESVPQQAPRSTAGVREVETYAFDIGDLAQARHEIDRLTSQPKTAAAANDRLRVADAFVSCALGTSGADETQLPALVQSASPITRTRAHLLWLAFGWPEPAAGETLLAAVRAIDPPERLADALDLLQYIEQPSPALARHYASLLAAVLDMIARCELPQTETLLHLVDLARVAGVPAELKDERLRAAAQAIPAEASVARLRYGLRWLDARNGSQVVAPFDYTDLLAECTRTGAGDSPLEALLKARSAIGLAALNRMSDARRMLDDATGMWSRQPAGRAHAELARVREMLDARTSSREPASPSGSPSHAAMEMLPAPLPGSGSGEALDAARGLARLTLQGRCVERLDTRLGSLSLDPLTRELLDDWRSMRDLLAGILHDSRADTPGASLQWITAPVHAALPWEFAVPAERLRLFCRGLDSVRRTDPEPSHDHVLIIKPIDSMSDFTPSESAASGFAIEHLYAERRGSDFVTTLVAPHPDELQQVLRDVRPAVIHIIGQLADSNAGAYYDFEGSERRLKGASSKLGLRLDALRLTRYLERQRPVVILDVTAPENVSDVVRMLLLRNRFAADLFASGTVRAVLAAGLAPADERESLSRALVSGIQDDTSLAFLWSSIREDDQPRDLLDLLSHCSAALFADDPYERIFGRRHAAPGTGSR